MSLLPKISIVTPSFNQGQFIEETIVSVLNQNYPNLEYIVIDGGSTDNTIDIIKKYKKYITYWVSEPDRGQTHAINKGFKKCTGDVFNWLNSDDYLEPDALFTIGNLFKDKKTSVLAARERRVDKHGRELNVSQGTTIYPDLSNTVGRCHLDQASTYFRKSLLNEVFPLSEELHYLMDAHMWMQFLLAYGKGNVKQMDKIIVNFRIHDKSKTVAEKDKFRIDKNSIENSLLNLIGKNNEINRVLKSRPVGIDYSPKWVIKQELKVDKVICHFALRSLQDFYLRGDFHNALVCLNYIRTNHPFLFSENNLSRFALKLRVTKKLPLAHKMFR